MQFDENKYKIYTWGDCSRIHWVINPIVVFIELLGVRAPLTTLVDKTSAKPRFERTFIPCPHCHTLHDSRTWSEANKTSHKNWFGLYCSNCGKIIPCLLNVSTLLLLAITFPLWFWFKDQLKARWLAKQPQRYANIDITKVENPYDKKWLKITFIMGGGISLGSYLGSLWGKRTFAIEDLFIYLAISLPIWLIFGYLMHRHTMKKGKPIEVQEGVENDN